MGRVVVLLSRRTRRLDTLSENVDSDSDPTFAKE